MPKRIKTKESKIWSGKLEFFRQITYVGLPTLVVLLVMTVVFWLDRFDSEERLRQETMTQAELRARQVNNALSEAVSMLFLNVDGTLDSFIDLYGADKGKGAFDQQVQAILKKFPTGSVIQVAVIDAKGYLSYTNLEPKDKIYLGDREHFTVHLNKPDPVLFVSKPIMGRVSKKWTIQFSRSIIQDGVFKGVMVMSVSPEYLYKTLSNLTQESGDVMLIVRNSGEIMARNQDFEQSIGIQVLNNLPFKGTLVGTRGKYQTFGTYDHVERVYHWERLKNYPATVMLGMSVENLTKPVEQSIANERFKALISTISMWSVSLLAVYMTLRMQSNIKRRIESEYVANHDTLTGLDNRKALLEHLQESLQEAQIHGTRSAVLFIDLDGFKPINDTYGHAAGDTLLKAVAQRIKRCARDVDFVARLGGDEFVVVLRDIHNRAEVQAVVTRIGQALQSPIVLNDVQLTIGASIGVATYPEQGQTTEALLDAADKEMYRVKNEKLMQTAPIAGAATPPRQS